MSAIEHADRKKARFPVLANLVLSSHSWKLCNLPEAAAYAKTALSARLELPSDYYVGQADTDPYPRSRMHCLVAALHAAQRKFGIALQQLKLAAQHARTEEERAGYAGEIGASLQFLNRTDEAREYLTAHVERTRASAEASPHHSNKRKHFCGSVFMLCGIEFRLGNGENGNKYYELGRNLLPTLNQSALDFVDSPFQHARQCKEQFARTSKREDLKSRTSTKLVSAFKPDDVVQVVRPTHEFFGERGEIQSIKAGTSKTNEPELFVVKFRASCPSTVALHGALPSTASSKTKKQKKQGAAVRGKEIKRARDDSAELASLSKSACLYTAEFQETDLKLIYSASDAEKAREEFLADAKHVMKQGRFCFGDVVVIHDLVNRPELNGRHCQVRRVITEYRPRYEVKLVPEEEPDEESKEAAPQKSRKARKHARRRAAKKTAAEGADDETSEVHDKGSGLADDVLQILPKNLKRALLPECTCGICQEELRDSVALPCGHKYCSKCIATHDAVAEMMNAQDDDLYGDASESSILQCPVCRTQITLSDEMWNLIAQATFQARQQRACAVTEQDEECGKSTGLNGAAQEETKPSMPMGAQRAHGRFSGLMQDMGINALKERLGRGVPEKTRAVMLSEEKNKNDKGVNAMEAFEEDYKAQRERDRKAHAAGLVAQGGSRPQKVFEENSIPLVIKSETRSAAEEVRRSKRLQEKKSMGNSKGKENNDQKGADDSDAKPFLSLDESAPSESSEDDSDFLGPDPLARGIIGTADDGSDDPVIQRACDIALNKKDRFGDGDQTSLSSKPGGPGCDLERYWQKGGNVDLFGTAVRCGQKYSAVMRAAAWGNAEELQAVLEVLSGSGGPGDAASSLGASSNTAKQRKEPSKEMRQLLELRESSLRITPLYACVIGAWHMNEHDPRMQFLWHSRPPPQEIDHVKCAELLLQAGANPDAKDVLGKTPLMMATNIMCSDESLKIAKLLLDYGADPDPHCRLGQCLIMDYLRVQSDRERGLMGLTASTADRNPRSAPLVLDGTFTRSKCPTTFPPKMIRLLISWGVDVGHMENQCDHEMNLTEKDVRQMLGAAKKHVSAKMIAAKMKHVNEMQKAVVDSCTHPEVKKLLVAAKKERAKAKR